ncbi:Atu4866 domain-containing protein [Promicromonospora thailandica]|uniref:Protein Atu4866 n=1 Tax=Promicromonospora thailandica TaxID=765201 RepID=A0A9X2GCF7_9MICO|nr:Atu4866 domain-containing protein [Promicromonospora thailandica]MCP2265971.1 protein Atu4866 [Promicromonospora thailandica]
MPAPVPAPSRITVTGALVHRTPTRTTRADLVTEGPLIAAPPSDDGAGPGERLTIDGSGASVVPLLVESVFAAPSPPARDAFDLTPGRPATFAVVDGTVGPDRITRMLVVDPAGLRAVVVDGRVVVRDGAAVRDRGVDDPADPRLGAWRDARRDMTQYLTPDGRYSETRGGRRDAWTGSFWLDGDRITYLDDTGFWAFGQYHDGVLHHAGFVLSRG